MASFSDTSFDTSAFSVGAFDFGNGPTPPPVVVIASTQIVGGGIPESFRSKLHLRTREDISRERARFGISDAVAQTINAIAARQAEALEQDEHKRFEELHRELQLKAIKLEAKHLEALNEKRQRLIDAEIKVRLQQMLDDEMVVLMLLAAPV